MNRQEAEKIAQQYIDSHCAHEVVILPEHTIEKPYGWVDTQTAATVDLSQFRRFQFLRID